MVQTLLKKLNEPIEKQRSSKANAIIDNLKNHFQ